VVSEGEGLRANGKAIRGGGGRNPEARSPFLFEGVEAGDPLQRSGGSRAPSCRPAQGGAAVEVSLVTVLSGFTALEPLSSSGSRRERPEGQVVKPPRRLLRWLHACGEGKWARQGSEEC